MNKQIFFEDIEVGTEVPALSKYVTTRQIVKFQGTVGDYMEYHYDKDFAIKYGFPDVLVPGGLTMSFLGQMVIDWIGEEGTLKKLACTWRSPVFPGQNFYCKGKVTKKYIQTGENYIECEVRGEDEKGEQKVVGNACITLPSKGSKG